MEIKFFQGNDVQYRNPGFLMMCKFLKLYVIIGFLLRMVLMLSTPSDGGLTFREVIRCLGIGVFPISAWAFCSPFLLPSSTSD